MTDQQQRLSQMEACAEKMYGSSSQEERNSAQNALKSFMSNVDFIPECTFLLDNSRNSYALLLASSSLLKLITSFWNSFTKEQVIELKNYLLNYLARNCQQNPHFVTSVLSQVVCRLIKLGWRAYPEVHESIEQIEQFLQASTTHYALGLQIYTELVREINTKVDRHSIMEHRKIAVSFRDHSLHDILANASLATLKRIAAGQFSFQNQSERDAVLTWSLKLALGCLTFDFIGTNPDETSDEFGALQIPSSWRRTIENLENVDLFFVLVREGDVDQQAVSMEILVQLTSCRRSLFSDEDTRAAYLEHIFKQSVVIMQNEDKCIASDAALVHFCRMLVAVKANYQLKELASLDSFSAWITSLSQFTMRHPDNEYLIVLWARMCTALAYSSSGSEYVRNAIPDIAAAAITARSRVLQIDDECRFLEVLARFDFVRSYPVLLQTLDQQEPQAIAKSIRIIGRVICSGAGAGDKDESLDLDARLCQAVVQLAEATEGRSQFVDQALLFFFRQWKRVHIGYDSYTSSRSMDPDERQDPEIYNRLGISQDNFMALMLHRIVLALKAWSSVEDVCVEALALLDEITTGYASAKILANLDAGVLMLQTHVGDQFPFMREPKLFKLRTKFYQSLTRLAVLHDFEGFLLTFEPQLNRLYELFHAQVPGTEGEVRLLVCGILRDLRGILMSLYTKAYYGTFFEWLYPNYLNLLLSVSERFWNDPFVSTPMLRFIAELAKNKSQRIHFPSSSPNGIIIFKEVSKTLQSYCSTLMATKPASSMESSDAYQKIFKGLMLCMQAAGNGLTGGYVNFGVFSLYNDDALTACIDGILKVIATTHLPILMEYPKVVHAYYQLFESLFHDHLHLLVVQEASVFQTILSSLLEGLYDRDTTVAGLAASAIDHLMTFLHTERSKKTRKQNEEVFLRLQQHLANQSTMFSMMLASIFNLLLFEGSKNIWSFSRPLFALIVADEASFREYRSQIIELQPPEGREQANHCFDRLMDGIQPSLDTRNRDKFTQNLVFFNSSMKKFIVKPSNLDV